MPSESSSSLAGLEAPSPQAALGLLPKPAEPFTPITAAERHFEALMDNIPDRIYFKDRYSRFLKINRALAKRLGLEHPDLGIGKSDFDYFTAEKAREFYEDEQRIIQTGQPMISKEEKQITPNGGVTWALVTKLPIRDASGKVIGLLGVNRDITKRKDSERQLEQVNRQLMDASRVAGMAETAVGVLHNVGNVLNSVNIAAGLIRSQLQSSRIGNLTKLAALLREHESNLTKFLAEDERGRQIVPYLEHLAQSLQSEQESFRHEVDDLVRGVEHIREIVAAQQNYARVSGVAEMVEVPELAENAVKLVAAAFERHGVTLAREVAPHPAIRVDKHKVLQILLNLLQNAKEACGGSHQPVKAVTFQARPAQPGRIQFVISDTGMGIAPETMPRLFSQGFTTRKDGHGFGLHSSVLAAEELGGSLTAQSEGVGKGATFTLELPTTPLDDQSASKN